jgi:hypothetical protein
MTEDLPPIIREFEVHCSLEHAFDTWTRRIDLWWPLAQHSVSHEDAASVTIEAQDGGRIFETTRNGKEIVWGIVNVWEPPNRFGYLWHIREEDASEATQVTIVFTALDRARTHVAIEHKGWENAGPKAGSRRSGNERGWDGLQDAFIRFVNGEVPHDQ